MNQQQLNILVNAVQHNCDISDARHGADYSLCVYLMKMREYYRWEQRLPYGAALEKDAVGNWLQAREQLWEALEDADWQSLCIAEQEYDPYDANAINQALAPHGLVYSSGLGQRAKPHFFLGRLERRTRIGGYSVYVAAAEYARDLTAPPAMSLGDQIFLRRESLRRVLWEKLESWRWNRPDNALGQAFACYDFDADLEGSLTAMTDCEIDNTLLHEQGEYLAGNILDNAAWNAMLLDLIQTPAELMARAVRDHLADCLVTLPGIGDRLAADMATGCAALHFYIGNLSPMRAKIFPKLESFYQTWRQHHDNTALRDLAKLGRAHWQRLGRQMIGLHRTHGSGAAPMIRDLIEQNPL
ncbi:MAG TPA: hypothetical protein DDY14_04580 [Chromatiaceae bacterium]|jgi:hypothetical protein|nr:MAG: hypothetical protein N838_18045 [Thiohalocapsa sp. PB-PSB1]HBG94601.1 hypothetical protein [Chromatiaceae bacterium]